MKRLVTLAIGGMMLLGGVAAAGEAEGVIEMFVEVPAPDQLRSGLQDKTREEIAKRVASRMRARLDAARVKFSTVRRVDASRLQVDAEADLGRDLLRGIVLAPGDFAVRPVRNIGIRWQEEAGDIPASIELRQEGKAIEPHQAYLWSAERGPIESFLEGKSFEDVDVFVYSTGDGWRTLAVGEPILTEEGVEDAEIRHVSTGAPFVSAELTSAGAGSFEKGVEHLEGELAVILDEEIVGRLEPSAVSGGRLNLTPPEQLRGKEAQTKWARQVAGRLAAAIPVELVESRE